MSTPATTPESEGRIITGGKFLTFTLAEEHYGVEVLKIREIIRMQKITAVPQMPPHVKGVINLRGKVVPVIDLRLKFGFAVGETTERTCIVVVQAGRGRTSAMTGLIVDTVDEVVNIAEADIEETPDFGTGQKLDTILGIAKIKGEVKTLLDIDRVVGDDRLL
ncbi:MAG: purine-binding chemotaxis protein CheW [Puniceicoccaceae bacterium]|nr:MAG: purine-binding chemotaxis protein CheW [Puniceicoccaceae bacterium]